LESSSSDAESEDSDAEMINEKVMSKFLDTYIKLKDDISAREFLKNKDPIFTDEDFIYNAKKKNDDKIKYTVNDALLNYKEESDEENIYSVDYIKKDVMKEDAEKKEILKQLNEDENGADGTIEEKGEEEDGNFVDEGFLKVKNKSSIIVIDDDASNNKQYSEKHTEPDLENLALGEALFKAKIKPQGLDMNMLQKIWGDEKNLDKNEKFLRNYILSEAWLENDENRIHRQLLMVDKEDDEKDKIFEDYEFKYNHRFEEEGGANITTYQRNITDSYRIKDDKRAEKRKEREQRKIEEKNKMKAQLDILKNAKISETKNKLAAIVKVAGTNKIKEILEELENEFDSKKFDEKMNKIFNEEYYKTKDRDEDIREVIEEKSFDYKTNKNILDKDKLRELDELEYKIEGDFEGNKEDEENNYIEEDYQDGYNENDNQDESQNEWFYCDDCKKAIKENKIKYECTICEDYTTCKDCHVSVPHAHKMKKSKVPLGFKPPHNWKEILENLKDKNNDDSLTCTNCSKEIIASYYFVCSESECSSAKICKTCRGVGKSVHEHKLSKFFYEENNEEIQIDPNEKLNNMIENVFSPVVDDIIAKQIPTKFHYVSTNKEEFELTDDMLVFLDDKTLNKHIPLKRLAPYREKIQMNDWQKKKMLNELSKEVDRKKAELARISEQTKENIKNNTQFLQNKRKNIKIDKKDIKKRNRLETYGIETDQ
jgi:protein KRI1